MVLAAVLGIAIWPAQHHAQAGAQAGAQADNQPAIADPPSAIVLQGGTLFDGTSAPPLGDAVVVIRGDRIVAVGRRGQVATPAGAHVLSTAGRTILPGFIDLHFHFDLRRHPGLPVAFQRAGGRLVVRSHGSVPNAETGFAFHRELETYVEAGLSPAQALVAATRAGAEALRLDDVGTIRPGKVADIVVVAGDPLTNIRDTRKIKLVIREGMVLDRAQVANRLRTLGE